jgi:hypothetical protein
MPTYRFRNKETNEIFDVIMRMSEYDQYKETNPTHERYHDTPIPMGDPVRLGVRKKDSGFKEVLQKIHERSPGSTLNKGSVQL